MAAVLKMKPCFLKLGPLLLHQRFYYATLLEHCSEAHLFAELPPTSVSTSGDVDTSKWRKLDARSLGLRFSNISHASKTVLRILQNEGYDAFLVGGCVRDLLLNRIPKDFDVVTTANLIEIKKIFHRAYIIGRRFPICKVHVRGSGIEVSSFDTLASHQKEQEVDFSEIPNGCDEKDFMRWRNSLHRDFTVNSLFYDPFARKVYDYSNGIRDLRAGKIRTLVPAHLSFQEDCARILRGLRIAARLGFLFSKDTEKAIHNLYESVKTLDKFRLMMEMNYMLSYGAARSSLLLLKRFNLLELLLPFHAAYLANNSIGESPLMLMELFSQLDEAVSCNQPCHSTLWVSLLAFHLALVNNPQDALVVWTLSSLLHHGTWEEGVEVAREHSKEHVKFAPEICSTNDGVSDDELAQRVSNFASIIQDSICALTDFDSLCKIMDHYPSSPCHAVVFISNNVGRAVADVFSVLVDDIKSLNEKRHDCRIDFELLGKGDILETRYVLGKVIMDTMRAGVTQHEVEKVKPMKKPFAKAVKHEIHNHKDRGKHRFEGPNDQLNQQKTTKQKHVSESLGEILSFRDIVNAKPEICDQSEIQSLKDMPIMLMKVPSTKQLQIRPPNQMLHVVYNATTTGEEHVGKSPIAMLNVLKVSEDPSPSYNNSRPEKQPTTGLRYRDESIKLNKTGRLSSLFR